MDWKAYEALIFEHLKAELPQAEVTLDVRLPGSLSEASRQVDILIREDVLGQCVTTAVDAKHHGRPIDVKHVEAFIGLLRDIGVERGVLVSKAGYTRGAYQRAFADDLDLDLDIFSLDEFERWQGAVGIPHSGSAGVVLPAPLGWVVDAESVQVGLTRLYQRGLTFDQAARQRQWMYVDIWHRKPPAEDLYELLEIQAQRIEKHVDGGKITSVSFPELRRDERCAIRHFEAPLYPTVEIAGFVEFERFIFFAVLFTPLVVQRRNTRKLEHILRRVLPVQVERAS